MSAAAHSLQVEATNRQILKISLPISFALLVPQVNFLTNNIFLSRLGEQELGSAGLTGVYYLIFAAIGYGLNNGLQALISRRAGENRLDDIGKLFSQGVRIALAIAGFGIIATYSFASIILDQLIHSETTFKQCIDFLYIRIWGLPFLFLYQMRNALLVGTNQSQYLIAGTAAEALANIFFDYTLIYGKLGFPELGFNGAAYASIIAEFIGMTVVYAIVYFNRIGRQFLLYRNMRYDAENIRLIIAQSFPLILQHFISIISWVFFYILVEHHGKRDLAISNSMRNVFGFFGVFTWAFAATTNTMVSNIIGQNKRELVIPLINKIMRISLAICTIIAGLLNLFPRAFLEIYGQSDAFTEEAIPILRVVSTALVIMSMATVWLYSVTGTGSTKQVLRIEFVAIVVYSVYVYLILEVLHLSIFWGWMAEWLYWGSLLSLSYLFIHGGKWRTKII